MTVFLTPDGEPIFAGTYFPKEDHHGLPSFRRVLHAIHDTWTDRRDEAVDQARALTDAIGRALPPGDDMADGAHLENAYRQLAATFDSRHGGFGSAPKFPQEPVLEFLLRVHDAPWAPRARQMLHTTLTQMARGGIYDHVGGGFARYSTDTFWLVPHFEKMLYNNAQLARIYLRASQVTGDAELATIAIETIDYVLRDLTNDEGGFMTAEDADSDGAEGTFYVWTAAEVADLLSPADAALAEAAFGIADEGNFEGANVLSRVRTDRELGTHFGVDTETIRNRIGNIRDALFGARATRNRPGLDDKVIVSWNGLMVRTLAEAAKVTGQNHYLDAARRNARFVLGQLRRRDGRLLRSWSKGRADIAGYLEDHAGYALGLGALYEATGEVEWYTAARELTVAIPELFMDSDSVLYATGRDAEELIVRPRDIMDNPTPSGSSMAAEAFLRLGLYTGDTGWFDRFRQVVVSSGRLIEHAPSAVGHLLAVIASSEAGMQEVAVVGADADRLAAELWQTYHPHLVVAVDRDGTDGAFVPLLAGRHRPGETLAYVCERMTCAAPVDDAGSLVSLLGTAPPND